MTRIRLILLVALAMAAVSVAAGAGASSAFAGSGPLWLVNGARFDCKKETGQYKTLLECLAGGAGTSGEWKLNELTGTSGLLKLDQGALALALNLSGTTNFVLKTSVITIECKHMSAAVVLVGGTPAKDHATIHFLECFVAGSGHENCTVNSPGAPVGLILVSGVKSEVIYLGSKKEAEKEEGKLGDLFSPEEGETLAELDIGGTGCPLFTKGELEVRGTVIGEIAPVGTMGRTGLLIFASSPIEKGFRWIKAGEVEEVESPLIVFGLKSTLSGEAETSLRSGEEWGVEER